MTVHTVVIKIFSRTSDSQQDAINLIAARSPVSAAKRMCPPHLAAFCGFPILGCLLGNRRDRDPNSAHFTDIHFFFFSVGLGHGSNDIAAGS